MSEEKKIIVLKPCCRCNEKKPLSEFCRGKNYCKACINKTSYTERNRSTINTKRNNETRKLKAILRNVSQHEIATRAKSNEIIIENQDNETNDEPENNEDNQGDQDDIAQSTDGNDQEVKMKTCIHCHDSKTEDLFVKGRNVCKVCHKAKCKERYAAKGHEQREKQKLEKQRLAEIRNKLKEEELEKKEKIPSDMKKCKKCNNIKLLTEFMKGGFDKNKKQLYRPECKECYKITTKKQFSKTNEYSSAKYHNEIDKRKAIYQKNKEWYKKYMAEWYIKNKESVTLRNKIYRSNNKDKLNKAYQLYLKEHPDKKLIRQCRRRVYSMLGSGKECPELIGCDSEFLHKWFTFQLNLSPYLTMENYGKEWHIDHVIPCASWDFDDEEQKKECFHWTNLAPLEAKINVSKQDKIVPNLILQQNLRIKLFEKVTGEKYPELILNIARPTIAGSS